MDIIKEILDKLDGKDRNNIYLREIALLMEEIEELKGKVRVNNNLIKNYEEMLGVPWKKEK